MTFNLSCGSSTNYATITANYVLLPDILGLLTYSSSGSSGSSGSAPPSVTNNTNPSTASGFSTSEQCGVMGHNAFSDPYCLWVSSGGKINGNNYVSLMLIDDSSASNPSYPYGNTTVTMTVELGNNNNANVTAMSVNFMPASGSPVNLGNSFQENYGAHLNSSVLDLSGYVSEEGQAGYLPYCWTDPTYCTLGMSYKDASWAILDLAVLLQSSSLTSSFYYYNVPNIASLVLTWRWTAGCVEALAVASPGVALMFAFPVLGSAYWWALTLGVAGGTGLVISQQCLSLTPPP